MLSLSTGTDRNCEGLGRRQFLQVGALTGLGLSLPTLLAGREASAAAGSQGTGSRGTGAPGKEVNCILIWTQGGTSHHDTFDPKPEAPVSVKGEFALVDTAVPGVQFTEVAPQMARELGRYGLLRSWNPANGSHGTADAWMMSGKRFNPAMTYPCYGSVISHQRGFKSALPPFVQLGENVDRRFGGGAPGYLGLEHGAFVLTADPNQASFNVRDITPPVGVDLVRVNRRRGMLQAIDALQRRAELEPAAFNALDKHSRAALNIITAPETKRAFDLADEDPRLRDRYGRTKFGQCALLSRRLIESGVRFVTLTDGGWDTHADNFNGLKRLMPPVDQGLPQLLTDLDERGMLDTTLVVWLTDFGRTPKINSASGRDHWATAGFAVMAGAGIPGGYVLGKTDGEGGVPSRDEYYSEDIAATIYAKLGIPLDLILTSPDGRPMTLNEGRPIREWL